MPTTNIAFVHVSIDAVDAVVLDSDGKFDGDHFDRYPSFESARDAALSSVELMLDEGDYDGDDHRDELVRMLGMLESAGSYEELLAKADYRWFIDRLEPARSAA